MGYHWWSISNGWHVLSYDRWHRSRRVMHGLVTRWMHPSTRWVWPEPPDFSRNDPDQFHRHLTLLMEAMDITDWGVVYLSQVHGTRILWNPPAVDTTPPKADGAITDRSALLLTVTVADCIPIWLYDEELYAVGLLHVGWRGTVQGILEVALEEFETQGSDLRRMEVVMGPCAQRCCYAVGLDVIEAVHQAYPEWAPYVLELRGTSWYLDLVGLNILQGRRYGLRRNQIHPLRLCTVCNPQWFFSHRRGETERMLAFAGLVPTE